MNREPKRTIVRTVETVWLNPNIKTVGAIRFDDDEKGDVTRLVVRDEDGVSVDLIGPDPGPIHSADDLAAAINKRTPETRVFGVVFRGNQVELCRFTDKRQ